MILLTLKSLLYLPKLTRPIFSTKMSRFAPAFPVIFIVSALSLSRTPWGTYVNYTKRKKAVTIEKQQNPIICLLNLHEKNKGDKGNKQKKVKKKFLSSSCMRAHTHRAAMSIFRSVHQLDALLGSICLTDTISFLSWIQLTQSTVRTLVVLMHLIHKKQVLKFSLVTVKILPISVMKRGFIFQLSSHQ